MTAKRNRTLITPALAVLSLALTIPAWADGFPGGIRSALGPRFDASPHFSEWQKYRPARRGENTLSRLRYWNAIAITASGIDHTPPAPGENRVFGEQIGPARSSRAMAIVHIAIFDAVNAIADKYQSYTGLERVPPGATSMDAAIAQAAHDTLVALFPSQRVNFDELLEEDLRQIRRLERSKANKVDRGIDLGQRAAAAILDLRANDGSLHAEPLLEVDFIPSDQPGKWRQDPVSLGSRAVGALWNTVTPFVLTRADQFRAPPPPALGSAEYTAAFNEVKQLGGDGIITPTVRTADQTEAGI